MRVSVYGELCPICGMEKCMCICGKYKKKPTSIDENEKLKIENEKYRKALITISCWRQKDPIYSENQLPNVIAEQALKADEE